MWGHLQKVYVTTVLLSQLIQLHCKKSKYPTPILMLVFSITAQGAYNARRAGITAAIVVAVLIPVGICGFCLILKLREKAAEKAEMR